MIDWDSKVLAPQMAVFGEPVTFIPASGDAPFEGRGVFREAYRQVVISGGEAVTTESPALGVRVAEFQSPMQALPRQDDQVCIRGVNYTIREVQVDGLGGADLLLNVAP